MAQLFTEFDNKILLNLCNIMDEVQKGAQLTEPDIQSQMFEGLNVGSSTTFPSDIIKVLFSFDKNTGYASCKFNAPLPFALSPVERKWLAERLHDSTAALFLSPELLQKLNALFPLPPIRPFPYLRNVRGVGDYLKEGWNFPNLQTYATALMEKKKIKLVNSYGAEKIFTPFRLQYNLATNRYGFILWDDTTFSRIPLSDVQSVEKLDVQADNVEAQFDDFLHEHQVSFTLQMEDKNNAIARCFSLFSSYDKESWRSEDGHYILKITYYDFDKEEILRHILSLGPQAVVIDPEPLRNEIIDILMAECKWFA